MKLEQTILQYLDGTLDSESSAELLHLLSVSPEKRAVLDEHIKLRELINTGQKPHEVPAHVEQQLMTRIPALSNEYAPLAVGMREAARSGLSRFLARPIGRTLGYAGGISAIVAGYVFFSNTTPDASIERPTEFSYNMPSEPRQSDASSLRASQAPAGEVSGGNRVTPSRTQHPIPGAPFSFISHSEAADAIHQDHAVVDQPAVGEPEHIQPLFAPSALSSVSLRTIAGPTMDMRAIASQQAGLPMAASSTPSFRVFLAGNNSTNFLPQVVGSTSKAATATTFTGGISYVISPSSRFGVEIGQGTFGELQSRMRVDTTLSLTRVAHESIVAPRDAMWGRLQYGHTLNPTDLLQFEVVAGAGLANGDELSPTFSLAFSQSYMLDYMFRVGVDVMGSYTSFVSTSQSSPSDMTMDPSGVRGTVRNEITRSRLNIPALDVRVKVDYGF